MGTVNRSVQLANLRRTQPKSIPYKGYEYYVGGRGSNKESAMLARMHETIMERNDSLDALEYSIQSLGTTGNVSSTTTSSSAEGIMFAFGSSSGTEPVAPARPGAAMPYGGSVEDLYKQRMIDRQPQDLMRCIYMLSHVFQRLTERRIELDSSDLRTLEPFEYRVRMNHLDELFMFVTHVMDNMTVETRPEGLREQLAERGLI